MFSLLISMKFLTLFYRLQKGVTPKRSFVRLLCRNSIQRSVNEAKEENAPESLIDFRGSWPKDERITFLRDMRVVPNFISSDEESKILEEIEPYMRRLHYEFDHWDDAIHGFRETERKQWYPDNRIILERVRKVAFGGEIMPYVHVLDLAEDGVIKPHVDSTRYCGNTIAGISLLSDCVMRLVRTDEKKFQQSATEPILPENGNDDYRNQPKVNLENNFYADILLQRLSLYIMSNSARYNFTHEVLSNGKADFCNKKIHKSRRISIICRNNP